MTHRLPTVRAKDVIAAVERAGFLFDRQKGSHATLPIHAGDIKRPLLKIIIRQDGLTEDRFRELL